MSTFSFTQLISEIHTTANKFRCQKRGDNVYLTQCQNQLLEIFKKNVGDIFLSQIMCRIRILKLFMSSVHFIDVETESQKNYVTSAGKVRSSVECIEGHF